MNPIITAAHKGVILVTADDNAKREVQPGADALNPFFGRFAFPLLDVEQAPCENAAPWGELRYGIAGVIGTPLVQIGLNARAHGPELAQAQARALHRASHLDARMRSRARARSALQVTDVSTDFGVWSHTAPRQGPVWYTRVLEGADFTPAMVEGAGIDIGMCARQLAGNVGHGAYVPWYKNIGELGSFQIIDPEFYLETVPIAPLIGGGRNVFATGGTYMANGDTPYLEVIGPYKTLTITEAMGWVTVVSSPAEANEPRVECSRTVELRGHSTASVAGDQPYTPGVQCATMTLVDGIPVKVFPWTVGEAAPEDHESQWGTVISAGQHIIEMQVRVLTAGASVSLGGVMALMGRAPEEWPAPYVWGGGKRRIG